MAIKARALDGAVLVPVKVVPGASRTRLMGEWDGRLKVAVAAPPERGRANAELVAHLAKLLGLRRTQVHVVEGETSPLKLIRLEGTSMDAVESHLSS